MDRVVQHNHPVFMSVRIGSVLSLVASAVFGVQQLTGAEQLLSLMATVAYLVCVQLPTVTIHRPLNNKASGTGGRYDERNRPKRES